MTLRRDIPTLEPDPGFIARLADLAAASTPSRGGGPVTSVVPVAFGAPATRAVAVAAALAAVTAGAAAAATQMSHLQHHYEPAPSGPSVGIHRPAGSARHAAHQGVRP